MKATPKLAPRIILLAALLLGTRRTSSNAAVFQLGSEIVRGNPDDGDCYMIERSGSGSTPPPIMGPDGPIVTPDVGCLFMTVDYVYYNGGPDENGIDTNFTQETYATIQLETTTGCDNTTLNGCIISVQDVGECNQCLVDEANGNVITLSNCSNLDGTFPAGIEQTFYNTSSTFPIEFPFRDEFFTLAPNQSHCDYYYDVLDGTNPSATPAPTMRPTTSPTQATTTTTSTTRLAIQATMEVGFFTNETLSIREPNPEELEEFIAATTNFYTDVLQLVYDDVLDSFEAILIGSSFDERRHRPLRVDFDAVAIFSSDDDDQDASSMIPSQEDLFATMKAADNETFVQQYLWSDQAGSSSSGSVFEHANQAIFDYRLANYPVTVTSNPTTSMETTTPTMHPTENDDPSNSYDSFHQHDILYGDHDNDNNKQCYSIERKIQRSPADPNTGCVSHYLEYIYYNGGTDLNDNDSGYPRETYAIVKANFTHLCDNADNNTCSVTATADANGVNTTTACGCQFYEAAIGPPPIPRPPPGQTLPPFDNPPTATYFGYLEIFSDDCNSLGGLFPEGNQEIELWRGNVYDYADTYFTLVSDEDRCDHPALDFYSQEDVLYGNSTEGQCYNVHRTIVRYPPNETTGCTTHNVEYIYFEADNEATTYFTVTAELSSGCTNNNDDNNGCSLSVDGVGTCQECSFNLLAVSGPIPPDWPSDIPPPITSRYWSELQILNCSNLPEAVFPSGGEQKIEFWSGTTSGDYTYTEQFFSLEYDEDRCEEPSDSPTARVPTMMMGSDESREENNNSLSIRNREFNDKAGKKTKTLEVMLNLHFDFAAGHGGEPDSEALELLATGTGDFFKAALLDDSAFRADLVGLTMEGIGDTYTASKPDEVEVTVTARVEIDAKSTLMNRQAADAMANANLNKYVHQYVRRNKSGHRNVLFQVRSLKLKAVSSGS